VAYIQNFEFKHLVRWVDCVTSNPSVPKVMVDVKLLGRIKCAYELLDLVQMWRDIKTQNMHLRIHNCYTEGDGVVYRVPGFDQRELVARAIGIAEQLQQQDDTTETKLLSECHEQFEDIDREKLCSFARANTQSCMLEGVGYHHVAEMIWV
jgi:hypothetical protein